MAQTRGQIATFVLLVAPAFVLVNVHFLTKDIMLPGEDAVMNANVMHPLFHSDEHFHPRYWKPAMKQSERLANLSITIHATAEALGQVGIPAFLESASLIGWLRHDRNQLPWDIDGDVGMLVEDCHKAGTTKAALQKAIGKDFEVMKFACSCEEACEGDNKRMAGRVAHKLTGLCIDIFAYAPVKALRSWQKEERYKHVEWWERVDDHADYTFPKEALLPLQEETFAGSKMLLPKDPREFLSWEYGRCLGVHIWPWRLMLYTPQTGAVTMAVLIRSFALSYVNRWVATISCVYTAVALAAFPDGIVVGAVAVLCLIEVVTVPFLLSAASKEKRSPLWPLAVALTLVAVLYELRGSWQFLLCQLDDNYIHPRRPKVWTLCLLGHCWDFGG
eukprot:TRINITY_DN66656_c0_g1_i1.p1 TRINITY_DN66656_c0_g1~~TRINITY_DN66656_c0_g1_i1.p1  ORF type:complete len:412 (-),score=45.04 TRINITY_DN66656_c0_g1_i1:230-1396(-)